jgi:hypothetical protein
MEQITEEELLESATTLATALRNAQRLFGYDAVTSHFDLPLAAEATADLQPGQADQVVHHGRWPLVLEGTRRLVKELGSRVVVLGLLTGPLTMARQLGDGSIERAGQVAIALGRAYAECGVGGVVVAEERAVTPEEEGPFRIALQPLINVARYFQITPILSAKGAPSRYLGPPSPAAPRLLTLPDLLFSASPEDAASSVEELIAGAGPGPLAVMSSCEVPPETPPETLHAIAAALKQ